MSTGMGGSPAASKVAGPAIALMVVGALTLLVALYYIVTGAMGGAAAVAPPPQVQGDAQMGQVFEFTQNLSGPVGIGLGVGWLVTGGLIIFGELKMKGLQSYGLATTASVLAMIPCVSPCCLAGLPIGIWSLVVLMNADVKAAFR